jgi:hypothetical protein
LSVCEDNVLWRSVGTYQEPVAIFTRDAVVNLCVRGTKLAVALLHGCGMQTSVALRANGLHT